MKKYFVLFLLLGLAASNAITAQIASPSDSIATLLCKTWQINYALEGDMQIAMKPGVQAPDFGFNKDKTLWISPTSDGSMTKGTWVYDAGSKTIKLTINGKVKGAIIKLRADQLIMSIDTKEATPDDPTLKMVFKVKAN